MKKATSKTLKVLVVEDVAEMRHSLVEFLKTLPGVGKVAMVQNTWEARLELRRHRPHLVFLDEILPGESSFDLLDELTQEGIAVILITSLEESKQKPLPRGILGRLQKPTWKSRHEDQMRFENLIKSLLDGPARNCYQSHFKRKRKE